MTKVIRLNIIKDVKKITIGRLKISSKAKHYVNEALNKNRLSYGPFTRRFENLFASIHEVPYAIASNSGTSALHVALAALKEVYKWPDNSEVIIPATTFVATANTVMHNKLKPVFVEVDPTYYEIEPENILKKITKKTRAIIPVHLFGQPADMKPIMEIAKDKNLRVIEDSAETMLARYRGKFVGSFGDIGCFSTYVAHLLPTGVGGFNTTKNPELAIILRSLINHGRDSIYLTIDDDDKASKKKLNLIIEKRFSFVRLGHSFRITELESAIGLAQLENEFHKNIEKRRKNAKILNSLLKDLEDILQLPETRPGNEHSFMMYPMVLKNMKKKGLVQYLEHRGIETRDLLPLINQPVYKKELKINPKDYPISKWIIDSGFYVGCHEDLTYNDLKYISSNIHNYLKTK